MAENRLWRPLSYCDSEASSGSRGEGVFIIDSDGNRYFDGYSGLWNVNLGYGNEAVKRAMHEQIDRLPFVNPLFFSESHGEELAERLCRMLPGEMEKVFFTCTGSEAVEAAVKAARKYCENVGKPFRNIAVFGNSYHGSYYGSMSASEFEGHYRKGYGPLLPGFVSMGIPYRRDAESREEEERLLLQELEEWIDRNTGRISALLLEPVIASGGVIIPPERYMKRLEQFCREEDLLLICDEIACGFGRTGRMFGYERYGFSPDLVTLSKGMNNGFLPVGAVCMSRRVVQSFREKKEILFHLSTQNLNPVSLTASLAAVEQYDEALLKQVREASRFWAEGLEPFRRFSCVRDIRICGLMIAIDLMDETGEPLALERLMELLGVMGKNGLLGGDSHIEGTLSCVLLFPPYVASRQQIRSAIAVLKKSFLECLPV